MKRAMTLVWLILMIAAFMVAAPRPVDATQGRRAEFAGMICAPLTPAQLKDVEDAYGEPAGVFVEAVTPQSPASGSGVAACDILISVRMPGDDEFYAIPPGFDDMMAFCEETDPVPGIRLLLLRRDEHGALVQVFLPLTLCNGVTSQEDSTAAVASSTSQAGAIDSRSFSFASQDKDRVLARAPDGSALSQMDVDVFGGVLAWAFGTRLTEAQKAVVRDALVEFWPGAPPQGIQDFRIGILSTPQIFPGLNPERREAFRTAYAQVFVALSQSLGSHPLAQVILEVSAGSRNVLAGAGTDAELTLQDAHAFLEYLAFTSQMQTGQPTVITTELRDSFVKRVVANYGSASPEVRSVLADMDERWAVLRAWWASAVAAQQQAVARRWQQASAQQQAAGWPSPFGGGGWQGASAGSEMSNSQFDAVMSSMDTLHQSSLSTLGAIDGEYDFAVYDSAGQWLYEY